MATAIKNVTKVPPPPPPPPKVEVVLTLTPEEAQAIAFVLGGVGGPDVGTPRWHLDRVLEALRGIGFVGASSQDLDASTVYSGTISFKPYSAHQRTY